MTPAGEASIFAAIARIVTVRVARVFRVKGLRAYRAVYLVQSKCRFIQVHKNLLIF